MRLATLHTALSALIVPESKSPEIVWQTFATELQPHTIEHHDIGHDWDFDKAQTEMLKRYFAAAHLMIKCLDVAYVTDRAAIEDRLLLPPKRYTETTAERGED